MVVPGSSSLDEPGGTQHGKVLADVREVAAELLCQLADGVFALAQNVQQHQPFRVCEYATHLCVEPVPLWIPRTLIVHLYLVPAPAAKPNLSQNTSNCMVAQVAEYWDPAPMARPA